MTSRACNYASKAAGGAAIMVKRTGVPYVDPAHSVDTESRYIDTQQIPILCRQCVCQRNVIYITLQKSTLLRRKG